MTKIHRIVSTLGMLVLVAGCAGSIGGSTLVTWEKPGVSPEQMRAEYGLCGGDFDSLGMPRFHPSEFAAIDACMKRKGFTTRDL